MCPNRQASQGGAVQYQHCKDASGYLQNYIQKKNKPPGAKKGPMEQKCFARLSQQEQNFVDGRGEFSRAGAISRMVLSIKKASLCTSAGEMVGSTNQVHLKHSSLLHKELTRQSSAHTERCQPEGARAPPRLGGQTPWVFDWAQPPPAVLTSNKLFTFQNKGWGIIV